MNEKRFKPRFSYFFIYLSLIKGLNSYQYLFLCATAGESATDLYFYDPAN